MLSIRISNPFGEGFKNLGSISGLLSKHKAWELEHYYNAGCILEFDISYTTKRDHAGFNLSIGLLSYCVHATIYDTRHWNTVLKQWVSYE